MNKNSIIALCSALLLVISAQPGVAFDHYDHWHDGDIHHFHEYDMEVWHHGYWVNQYHDGRPGWWWVAGGSWYFYPAPVYPYPDPYLPPGVVITQPSPVPQYWYCANPAGYYPYVPQCAVQWQPVAATAPAPVVVAPAPVAPQPPIQPSGARDTDDRQLNAFAVELDSIHAGDAGARTHIKDLKARVAAFHQVLFTRTYNAMDILQDTENLEKRIDAKRKELATAAAATQ